MMKMRKRRETERRRCSLVWSVKEGAARAPISFNVTAFKDHRYAFPHMS